MAKRAPKLYPVIVYATDGTVARYNLPKKSVTLRWLQDQVGGNIETVPTSQHYTAVLNEEGRIHNLPRNDKFAAEFPAAHQRFGDFHGPVVVVPTRVL